MTRIKIKGLYGILYVITIIKLLYETDKKNEFFGRYDILSKSLYFNPVEFYISEYSQI